jgi:hypothetical protein
MSLLSVIIPLAPQETAWQVLLLDLHQLPEDTEVWLVTANSQENPTVVLQGKHVHWLCSAKIGRVLQMNAGAVQAHGDYL